MPDSLRLIQPTSFKSLDSTDHPKGINKPAPTGEFDVILHTQTIIIGYDMVFPRRLKMNGRELEV
jgi:hypothetical protein